MKAIRYHRHGGPEVLDLDEIPSPEPAAGEIRIAVRAAGVNYIDVYRRTGFYPSGVLPAIAGLEGAGIVDAVGEGVDDLAAGDRVAWFDAAGSYAEQVILPAERALPVPPELSFEAAAALPLQGMTAHYLTHTIRPLAPGDTVLVHAAAGGVGLLAVQMAKLAGATVIGTCSTPEKARRAKAAGADHAILYEDTNFANEVLRVTDGRGVDLALDGVGKATFVETVRATRVRGHVVLFGQSSGAPDPVEPRKLLGSRTLTSASLFDYTRDRAELLERAGAVFAWARKGAIEVAISHRLPLAEAEEAHLLLEGRQTIGKVLLLP